ncbi:MAG: alkaline phosphatase [Gemmatimonadota bacterium]|nr:MAG: alkaline phosphatase [Gemmatimonadota bacterium]
MVPRSASPAILMSFIAAIFCATHLAAQQGQPQLGSAIFIHPDGSSVSAWSAARLLTVGPDGQMNWDRLEHLGVYRGHLTNSLGSTSHGGATAHAFGVKVPFDSYGMSGTEPLTSLSGKPFSLMQEARQARLATAVINSGHLAEPGTGVFLASAYARIDIDTITLQIIESGTDIILGGGEVLLLPPDVVGRHGVSGIRRDGRNLVERAKELGYTIVYTREELLAVPTSTEKVLGLFSYAHTFNDRSEQVLRALGGAPLYSESAPSVAEMLQVTLRLLEAKGDRFLVVLEEEGSDNFANTNNAIGTLTALARADTAIGVALEYVAEHPNTLVITAADSDAGGLQVVPVRDSTAGGMPLDLITANGAPLDGFNGTASEPFVAQPDQFGNRLPFGIAWTDYEDLLGGIVARAQGLNAELLPTSVDNTDIYRMLYATLFGKWLP